MKHLLNRKFLLLSVTVCLLVATLSLLFLPVDDYRVGVPMIVFFASFITSFFVVGFIKQVNKQKVLIIRIVITSCVVLSTWLYIAQWNRIVCKVTNKQILNDKVSTTYKNIISGTVLIDTTDEVINRVNTTRQHCSICDSLNENNPEKIWLPNSVQASKLKLHLCFLLLLVSVAVLLVDLAAELLSGKPVTEMEDVVFISYNHGDELVTKELCTALLQQNIPLIVDSPNTAQSSKVQNMIAGDSINTFIKKSVLQSKITLMIVSENSLLSGWVATETVNTFFFESFDDRKKFIACYSDDKFLNNDFAGDAIRQIDSKLAGINTEIAERIKQQADSRDLNDQKTRLLSLRANLDLIIQRLQNSLCIPIANGKLQENLPALTKAIQAGFDEEG
ncbi:MAG: toll/interleukin-1 receptor domain-containing protein [Bacteroidetes bacterium]|nr:toll/interleukin-1 receptor domain-containing protein [Bacteroidota bacterium]